MSLLNRKIIISGLVGFSLLAQSGGLPSYAYAQETGIEDVSVTIDELPPQPTQSTLPEELGTIDAVAAPSAEALTPMVESQQNDTIVNKEALVPEQVQHSGQYFDSDSIIPNDGLKTAVGPREVDPKYEPGSTFVVVRKGAGADSVPARLVSAQRALQLGRYTSALELYEQLYKQTPKNKQVLMGLAVAQQYSGFNESAIATYEELLAMDPDNTDATVNMLGLLKSQYPSVAYRKLKDLWEKNSQNAGLAAQLGLTSAAIGNAQEAIRYLGIAATLEPENASHYFNMAVVSDQAGASKDAVDLYQKALEVDAAYGASRTIPREQVYDRLAKLRRL